MKTIYPNLSLDFSTKVNKISIDVPLPAHVEQIVFINTDSWIHQTGTLQMLSRSRHNSWVLNGASIPVIVGRSGLAWGRGVHELNEHLKPRKIEGGGKGPAGIFRLGVVFGHSQNPPTGTRLSYRHTTDRDYYIDDSKSPDYNQWIKLPTNSPDIPKQLWESFERMKRNDHLYELGIVIQHNTNPVVAGEGSAIFFHVWQDPNIPTVGCTAMAREDMLALIQWLDPKKNLVLIQVPIDEVDKLQLRENLDWIAEHERE